MVHWVYVLECEDSHIYVGETDSLYTRMKQHMSGKGAMNTKLHRPKRLIGLYKVNDNHAFIDYRETILRGDYNRFKLSKWNEFEGDNLLIENRITERLIYERTTGEWYKVRGGKYTRRDLETTAQNYARMATTEGLTVLTRLPICDIPTEQIVDRPLCKCGMPSEVNISKDHTKIYFKCSMSNIWPKFSACIPANEPCDFWQAYTEDKILRTQNTIENDNSICKIIISK